MKPHHIIASGLFTGSLFCCFCSAHAETKVPCLIFTGASDTELCLDLEKLNRITFTDNGMTVSSLTDGSVQYMQLLYSLFNHIEIGDAVPTASSGVDEIVADTNSRLVFVPDIKSIVIESASEASYSVGIFSLKGMLIAMSNVCAGQPLPVEALVPGVYVAVATDGESQLTLKFILK